MTILAEALNSISWDLIALIGRRHGLGIDSNLPKSALIDKVAARLTAPAHLTSCLAQLQPPERAFLTDLLVAGGRLELPRLSRRYGRIRIHRALVRAGREQSPLSAPEQLLVLGVLFVDNQTVPPTLFVPADLIDLLPTPAQPSAPARPLSDPGLAPVDLLCHDLASLLAYLQREDVVPLHGRWLPPRFLAAWSEACAVTPDLPHARSELQTNRRRFLHYLAEAGGWLELSGGAGGQRRGGELSRGAEAQGRRGEKKQPPPLPAPLFPGPAAWLWLNGSRPERLQTLWDIWANPNPELWAAFRLPGTGWLIDPARLLGPIHQALLDLDPADPDRFATWLLKQQPHLQDLVPGNLLDPLETLTETIAQLLRGPLVWLGALRKAEGEGMKDEDEKLDLNIVEGMNSFILHPSSLILPPSLILTPQGRAWLTGQSPPIDQSPAYAKFSIITDLQDDPLASALTLTLKEGLPEPIDWVVALEVGRQQDEGGLHSPFILHPSSFILALHHGWSPPALRDALAHLAERPLTGAELDLLRAWAEAAGRMTLRQALILETTEPEVITRLASTQRGRALIERTLSPRVVVVDPAKHDQLVRRLTKQEGAPPKAEGGRRKDEFFQPSSFSPHPSALWLALQVYRGLGQLIRLPVRIPQQVLDQVAAGAGPADLASADIAAEQTLAALRQLIDGRAPFPPWPEEGLPEEESLTIIEAALKAGHGLQMSYYTAGRDELTHRLVEPYRLEWHGRHGATESGEREADSEERTARSGYLATPLPAPRSSSGTPYLVGFCHRAQAERVFRVDRIRALVSVPLPDEPGQPWGE